jgi:hypothetical protein
MAEQLREFSISVAELEEFLNLLEELVISMQSWVTRGLFMTALSGLLAIIDPLLLGVSVESAAATWALDEVKQEIEYIINYLRRLIQQSEFGWVNVQVWESDGGFLIVGVDMSEGIWVEPIAASWFYRILVQNSISISWCQKYSWPEWFYWLFSDLRY